MNGKKLLLTLSLALNAGLLIYLVLGTSQPAVFISEGFAQNRAVQGGGYAATTASVTSSRKALWIADNTEKRMAVYLFPSARGKPLTNIGAIDLRKDFGENLAGEVMLLPGEISGDSEAVYVIDPVGKQLRVYVSNGKEVEMVGLRDLGADFRR